MGKTETTIADDPVFQATQSSVETAMTCIRALEQRIEELERKAEHTARRFMEVEDTPVYQMALINELQKALAQSNEKHNALCDIVDRLCLYAVPSNLEVPYSVDNARIDTAQSKPTDHSNDRVTDALAKQQGSLPHINDPENQPHQFNSRTIFHPNETVQETADALGIELPNYTRIEANDCVFLQHRTGVDATFWMNLQDNWDAWNRAKVLEGKE